MKNASGLKLKNEGKKSPELKIGNEDGTGYRALDKKWCRGGYVSVVSGVRLS